MTDPILLARRDSIGSFLRPGMANRQGLVTGAADN